MTEEPLETVFAAAGLSAEVEAQSIHALLDSNGIESLLVRDNVTVIPAGRVEVRVLRSELERARQIIEEGAQAGPELDEQLDAESEF